MGDASTTDAETSVEYVAEGAANIIYRPLHGNIKHAVDTALQAAHVEVPDPLLRLRKDLPHLQSVQDQFARYNDHVAPLFSAQHLIPQLPIPITQDLISELNADLAHHETTGRRPSKRHGQSIAASETHALALTDMAADLSPKQGDALIELKPKWLHQSPNAPPASRRCRTCALRAMRGAPAAQWCPLDLAAGDAGPRLAAALLAAHDLPPAHPAHGPLAAFLAGAEALALLRRLRDLQCMLDGMGVLGLDFDAGGGDEGEGALRRFLLATTLRDCTLFVRVHGGQCEARLGDFDLKMAEPGKVAHWRGLEERLIAEGWYTEAGRGDGLCRLERA